VTNPRRKRNRTRRSSAKHRRHSNPRSSRKSAFRRRHHRSRRNPAIGGFQSNEILKLALGATGGTLGTKYLTELVLKDKNTGATGYAVSAAVAIALAWASRKFLGDDKFAEGVLAGGAGAVVLRIWQDQVSGTSLSGLGDPDMRLGEYATGFYTAPQWGYGQPALPAAPAMTTATGAPSAAAVVTGPARNARTAPRR